MSTTDISFADQLQNRSTATRVHIKWIRMSCAVDRGTVKEFANSQSASPDLLRATKTIIDRKHPVVKALTATRNEIQSYWHGLSLPYVETGIRLINRDTLPGFVARMQEFKTQLAEQTAELADEFASIIATAEESLGSMFNANDYPRDVEESISCTWDFPSISPPEYLKKLDPALYEAEQRKIQSRFEESVALAENMFATDFSKLVTEMAERLTSENAKFPQRKLDQITRFIERFRSLSIGSSESLDTLVADLESLSGGVTRTAIKDDNFRSDLATKLNTMGDDMNALIESRPTRRLR